MSGMAEILDENSRLRAALRTSEARNEALLEAQQALEAQVADLTAKAEALVAVNERFAKHLEWLDKKRELARAERFIADENQAVLFESADVTLPPRDPRVEEDDKSRPKHGDGRKRAKHARRGRRDLSELKLDKKVIQAPISPAACTGCGGSMDAMEPRVTHRLDWEPGRHVVLEVHQHHCACPKCPDLGVWTAPEPFPLPGRKPSN